MSVEPWTLDALVEAYRQHQRSTRGLRERTLDGYARLVRSSSARRSERTRLTRRVFALVTWWGSLWRCRRGSRRAR
jgi:hypothetical protein